MRVAPATTGSRRAAYDAHAVRRPRRRGADALDVREDLAALVVHGDAHTGGIVDMPHAIEVTRS